MGVHSVVLPFDRRSSAAHGHTSPQKADRSLTRARHGGHEGGGGGGGGRVRYLLVEDNLDLAEAVVNRLALDGHAVDHAASLAAAEDCLAVATYDLILLDVMLPDGDGLSFLGQRRARVETPVIILTARSHVSDRVGALDLGADDYITKALRPSPNSKRGAARVLRRRGGSARNEISLGPSVFDPMAGTLRRGTDTVDLRNREIRLLEVFARHPGQILSKMQLMDRLFSHDAEVTENAIEVYVGRLRRRIDGMGGPDRDRARARLPDGGRRLVTGSIGRRLTLLLAGVAALLSVLSWGMVTALAREAAERAQDNVLAASATTIAETLRSEQGEVRLELPYSAFSMLGAISEDRVFYLVTAGDETLTGYPDLPVAGPLAVAPRPRELLHRRVSRRRGADGLARAAVSGGLRPGAGHGVGGPDPGRGGRHHRRAVAARGPACGRVLHRGGRAFLLRRPNLAPASHRDRAGQY